MCCHKWYSSTTYLLVSVVHSTHLDDASRVLAKVEGVTLQGPNCNTVHPHVGVQVQTGANCCPPTLGMHSHFPCSPPGPAPSRNATAPLQSPAHKSNQPELVTTSMGLTLLGYSGLRRHVLDHAVIMMPAFGRQGRVHLEFQWVLGVLYNASMSKGRIATWGVYREGLGGCGCTLNLVMANVKGPTQVAGAPPPDPPPRPGVRVPGHNSVRAATGSAGLGGDHCML